MNAPPPIQGLHQKKSEKGNGSPPPDRRPHGTMAALVTLLVLSLLVPACIMTGPVQNEPLPAEQRPLPESHAVSRIPVPSASSPVVTASPGIHETRLLSVFRVGEEVRFGGETILAPGDRLVVEVFSPSFQPTAKGSLSGSYGASRTVAVQKGPVGGLNHWEAVFQTAGWSPGEYTVLVTGIDVPVRGEDSFLLSPNI